MLKHNEKLEKHQKNFGKFEVYLTFKTQNAFEVKWYSIKSWVSGFFELFTFSWCYGTQKKQFLQAENLRQRLKKYVEVSSILNLVATVT